MPVLSRTKLGMAVKLSTAIAQTSLRRARVVVGAQGVLDNEIQWVHVVDHPSV